MSGFPVYVPNASKKEISIEKLMEKINVQQTLIAAYCSISGNGYVQLVPDNSTLPVLVAKIGSFGRAAVKAFEGAMNLSEAYGAHHRD